MNGAAKCHLMEKHAPKNSVVCPPHLLYSSAGTVSFLALFQSQNAIKGKCFELIQDTDMQWVCTTASQSDKNDRINVSEEKRSILKQIFLGACVLL